MNAECEGEIVNIASVGGRAGDPAVEKTEARSAQANRNALTIQECKMILGDYTPANIDCLSDGTHPIGGDVSRSCRGCENPVSSIPLRGLLGVGVELLSKMSASAAMARSVYLENGSLWWPVVRVDRSGSVSGFATRGYRGVSD